MIDGQPAPPTEQTIFSYSSPWGPIADCASWLWPQRPHIMALPTSGPRDALMAFMGEHSSTGVDKEQTRIKILVITAFQSFWTPTSRHHFPVTSKYRAAGACRPKTAIEP